MVAHFSQPPILAHGGRLCGKPQLQQNMLLASSNVPIDNGSALIVAVCLAGGGHVARAFPEQEKSDDFLRCRNAEISPRSSPRHTVALQPPVVHPPALLAGFQVRILVVGPRDRTASSRGLRLRARSSASLGTTVRCAAPLRSPLDPDRGSRCCARIPTSSGAFCATDALADACQHVPARPPTPTCNPLPMHSPCSPVSPCRRLPLFSVRLTSPFPPRYPWGRRFRGAF